MRLVDTSGGSGSGRLSPIPGTGLGMGTAVGSDTGTAGIGGVARGDSTFPPGLFASSALTGLLVLEEPPPLAREAEEGRLLLSSAATGVVAPSPPAFEGVEGVRRLSPDDGRGGGDPGEAAGLVGGCGGGVRGAEGRDVLGRDAAAPGAGGRPSDARH